MVEVAQQVEQSFEKRCASGSIPLPTTNSESRTEEWFLAVVTHTHPIVVLTPLKINRTTTNKPG